jgi:hypothetical protein
MGHLISSINQRRNILLHGPKHFNERLIIQMILDSSFRTLMNPPDSIQIGNPGRGKFQILTGMAQSSELALPKSMPGKLS